MPKRPMTEEPDRMDAPEFFEEQYESAVTKMKNAVVDTAEKAQEKAQEVGRAVRDQINDKRGRAADQLETVASQLRERAETLPGREAVTGLVHSTANKVQATAEYVREHDVKDMMAAVEKFVLRHPGQSLIAAVAVGFLLGRAVRSVD